MMLKRYKNFIFPNKSLFLVGIGLFTFLLAAIYHKQGILEDKEAEKYWGSAQDILSGDFRDFFGTYKLYSGYILYLLPFAAVKFKIGAIIGQCLLHILAAKNMQKTILQITNSNTISNTVLLCYFLAFPIHQWTLSYYSEGLFIPLSVLFLCSAFKTNSITPPNLFLGVVLIITRPIGLLFVLPVLILRSPITPIKLVPLLLLPLAFLFAPILPEKQLQGIAENHVILGQHENTDIVINDDFKNLYHVQKHTIHNKGFNYWLSLLGKRVLSLFNPTRPWFSPLHNVIVSLFILLYLPIIISIFLPKKHKVKSLVLCIILLLNSVLVALTYDEWDARFFASIFPAIVFLSGLSMANISAWHTNLKIKH